MLLHQVVPRFAAPPGMVFTGAPQGGDQWHYFAVVRAVWRGGNGFTYSYPYSLFWQHPPMLFQLPFAVLAWVGALTGLPAAFELWRVAGAALAGCAIGILGRALPLSGRARTLFYWCAVAGGGWFGVATVYHALSTSGVSGLSELPAFLHLARGPLDTWKVFLAENLLYPLEPMYHAIVIGGLAAIAAARFRLALVLAVVAWASNPFPAAVLCSTGCAWWLCAAVVTGHKKRAEARRHLAGWILVSAAGLWYYIGFLGRWPALAEMRRINTHPLVAGMSPGWLLLLTGPWLLPLGWSVIAREGRRLFWRRPKWRVMGLLVVTQFLLVSQLWLVGDRATQPLHFVRGYLVLGLSGPFLCMLGCRGGQGIRRLQSIAMVLAVLSFGDTALFWTRELGRASLDGCVRPWVWSLVQDASRVRSPRIAVCNHESLAYCLAAFTPHQPYDIPRSMLIPFRGERLSKLDAAASGRLPEGVAGLGVTMVLCPDDGPLAADLSARRWTTLSERGGWIIMVPESGKVTSCPAE